ncbi:uncharacterized protein LOC9660396 isoform X1 [Selaginella moellendorffii]|uniref:uncharacterized protein LOC9660396 isoform X1 n=1 Tax=Selaginella moellendorffii TaxID=88036 RepID=UPI000D1C7A38|nr:uncharacterized protein LOC9660396 isoform X1 [Selaginella moellendorffii]|eukprot:XP_024540000.1 uncharacterized protein LOC9660396 isoform X1 [Selaginella moellendorffii]
MWKREFTSDFTALTKDGAEWIAQNTSLKLIGTFRLVLLCSHAHIYRTRLPFRRSLQRAGCDAQAPPEQGSRTRGRIELGQRSIRFLYAELPSSSINRL